jgi:hypothetical protein
MDDGTPIDAAAIDRTNLIKVTVIPNATVVCDGCGHVMVMDGGYVKGSDGINFYCLTRDCVQKAKLIYFPFERFALASLGTKE